MKFFAALILGMTITCLAVPGPAMEKTNERSHETQTIVETVEVVGRIPLNRVVQSVTVQEANLQAMGAWGLKDLLNRTPGFLVLNSGHFGQMSYAFARGAAVNQTLFIIDGVKVSDPSSSLGLNFSMIPSLLVERVEIVRGPLGGLYGSSAMGGVVSLTSRRDEGVSAAAGFGSHGTWQTAVHAAGRFGDWQLALNADLNRFNHDLDNDEFNNRGVSARAMFQRGSLEAGLQLFIHSASSGIPTYMGLPAPDRRYDQGSLMAALPITWTRGEHIRIKIQLSHNTNVYEFNDPNDAWAAYFKNRSRINDFDASISGRFTPGWHFRAGLNAAFHTIMNQTGDTADMDDENSGYFSGYAGSNLNLGKLLLTANLRIDKYRDVNAAWSPQVGASFLVTDHFKLRASWGKGFRAPTLPERLNPSWGNPNLKPEASRSLEGGVDLYRKDFNLGIVWFDTRYRDLIGFSPLTWRYANLNEAVIRGLEANLALRPLAELELRAAWTWLHTHDRQYDRQLLRRPEHAVSAGFTWTRPRFTLGGEMVYVGRRLDFNELDWIFPVVEVPAFNTFSFHATVSVTPTLSLEARVTNAFNADYAEIYGYPAPGTRVMAGLRFQTD
ncbi:MAG TPA: TonB-dependent receptor [Candidatus Aminicenantes bacterium]|nr:TonB-dependent receptor [Candidatus Aminicenantes bacterium]